MKWEMLHPQMREEMLGLIPVMLCKDDPRPAREQFNTRYICGWQPFQGFTLEADNSLSYLGRL